MVDLLYHYGSNNRCLNILKEHAVRMSDIGKSNDSMEMRLLFPDILDAIEEKYIANPFPLKYETTEGVNALRCLLNDAFQILSDNLNDGTLSNLVLCFSEDADLLSQWRGYANDGKGVCLGFSAHALKSYCEHVDSVIRLEQVKYITEKDRQDLLNEQASAFLDDLNGLREWIVDNMTHDDKDPDTDGLLGFNVYGNIESRILDSLVYKQIGFQEEKEWRLFFSQRVEKNPEWVLGAARDMRGPRGFSETVAYLRNKIRFNITEDCLVPYLNLDFSEIENIDGGNRLVREIWLGPKSKILNADLELFLKQNGYSDVAIKRSGTSYR